MGRHLTTRFGDRVGFDRVGTGPAVIFIAGAGPWREIDPTTTETAELLADRGMTAIVHDRVGRGVSFVPGLIDLDRAPAAIEPLIAEVGGSAVLCGHSSGWAIALRAAVDGPGVGTTTYNIIRPAAESIAGTVPGAIWKEIAGKQYSWKPTAMADEIAAIAGV